MSLLSLSQSKEGDMSLLLLTSRKTKRVPNQYITRCLIHWNLSFVRKWRSEAEEFQWEKNDQHHESEREETIETIISPSNKETDCTSSFKISKSFGTERHHLFIHAISLMHCVYRFLIPQRTDLLKKQLQSVNYFKAHSFNSPSIFEKVLKSLKEPRKGQVRHVLWCQIKSNWLQLLLKVFIV